MENWKPIFFILFSIFVLILSHYKKWDRCSIIGLIYFFLCIPTLLANPPFNLPISSSLQDSIHLAILGSFLIFFSIQDQLDNKYYIIAFYIIAKSLGAGDFLKI